MAFMTLTVLFVLIIATVLWNRSRNSQVDAAVQMRRLGIVVAVVVLFFMATSCITVIKAGHVGVVDIFGKVSPVPLKSGIQIVNPFAHVVQMSVQTQEIKETMDVPSKEGMTMGIEVSVLSITRGVTASYEAKALYTSEREAVAELIKVDLVKVVEPRGVVIESSPLRRLSLPARITTAIEEKLSADQESQRMTFVLAKEKQEAERKRIEAQGVADFQKIVTDGISDKLLQWKGIEATQDLAKSPNAKIVIIGNGKNGLPLVLGDVK